jgi:hypothetical protein
MMARTMTNSPLKGGVLLGNFPGRPATWVVPRDHVAAAVWIGRMSWRRDPAAKPGTRNAGIESARLSGDVFEHYCDRWDLLDQPATEAPVLLPHWMRRQIDVEGVGLPRGHPWHDQIPPFS